VITRTYETTNVPGRSTGFNLGAGYAVIYGYEAGTGRFRSVNWSAGGESDTATYSYVPNSDLLYQLNSSTGLITTYNYEADRNLKTRVKNEFNAQLISQYDYNYNSLGLREHSNTSGSAFTQTPIEPTPETSTYTTNTLNQYTQITKDNGQQTTYTLTYDDDGNLTSIITTGATKVYKYNAENRLIAVEPSTPINGDKKVEFVYDYMGRRVQKKVYIFESSAYSLQSIHLYVYDGWNLILEMDGTGSVQKSYVWGLDLNQSLQDAGGIGGLLSVVDTGEAYNYLYDVNGNVGQLIDSDDGSIVAHYEYDPFGILFKSTGAKADDNSFRFSTKYYDAETSLYYYGYRYYSPNLGRWINRDPMEEEGGFNLYGFVINDPIDSYDILGLKLKSNINIVTAFNTEPFPKGPDRNIYGGFGLKFIMENSNTLIPCPNCGFEINLEITVSNAHDTPWYVRGDNQAKRHEEGHLSDLQSTVNNLINRLSDPTILPHNRCLCRNQSQCFVKLGKLIFLSEAEYYKYLNVKRDIGFNRNSDSRGLADLRRKARVYLNNYEQLNSDIRSKYYECLNIKN
jgi:RHS repeat-associated protein